MLRQSSDREQGFTLIELLMAIAVSGLIISALAMGFIVTMKGTAGAHDRFVESNGAQTLATYFTSDVESANPTMVSTAAADNTGCSSTPALTKNVLRLQWTELTTATQMTAFSVSYRTRPVGSNWQLVRYACSGSQSLPTTATAILSAVAPAEHIMVQNLYDPTVPSPYPTTASVAGRKITLQAFAALGQGEATPYSYSLSASMRTAATSLFTLSAASPQTAGSPFSVTVTATKNGITETSYTGTVQFTSSDPMAMLPANYTFVAGDNGVHVFTNAVTLKTAGSKTVTVTDTAQASKNGTATFTVNPAAAVGSFTVTAPGTTQANTPFSATIMAQDAYGNQKTNYTGTIHFTSNDPLAALPSNYTFVAADNGVRTFTNGVTLKTTGSKTVAMNDTVILSATGSAAVTVTPAAVSSLLVSAPATSPAGTGFSVTVTAKDGSGTTVTGYSGTVHFTSTDGLAVLPSNYTFVAADLGAHTFTNVILKTTGSKTVTATDTTLGSVNGTSNVTVTPAALGSFTMTGPPASTTAGPPFSATVTAKDVYGNIKTDYTGRLHFSSTDSQATLPGDYTYVTGDNGVHSFTNGVTLKTAGSKTVTVNDTVLTSVTQTATVTVSPNVPSMFVFTNCSVNGGTSGTCSGIVLGSGAYVDAHVTAQDAYGNTPTVTGTLTIDVVSSHNKFVVSSSPVTITGPATESSGTFRVTHTNSGANTATITATSGSLTGSMTVSG